MGLSIKNEHAEKIIRELAEIKGVSLVTAVTLAVEDKLAHEKAAASDAKPGLSKYERLMAYAREYERRVTHPVHSWEVDGLLYDEDGLPK